MSWVGVPPEAANFLQKRLPGSRSVMLCMVLYMCVMSYDIHTPESDVDSLQNPAEEVGIESHGCGISGILSLVTR